MGAPSTSRPGRDKVRVAAYSFLTIAVLVTALFALPLPSHGHDTHLPIPAGQVTSGYAARWHTCTIGVQVNTDVAPPGALEDLNSALAIVSGATGVHFSAPVAIDWPAHAAARQRDGYITVFWAWPPGLGDPTHRDRDLTSTGTPTSSSPQAGRLVLTNETAGSTNTVTAYRGRRGVIPATNDITSASVSMNAARADFGGRTGQLGFLVHELGHALGLGHSAHPRSVMAPAPTGHGWNHLSAFDARAYAAIAPTC